MSPDRPPTDRLAAFTVGDWTVDPKSCEIARAGAPPAKLRAQLVELLLCLASRPGKIVLRDEILAQVWPGQYVAESGLSRCIAELRQALQDDAQQPRFIETIPKRGYRLVAPVRRLQPTPAVAGGLDLSEGNGTGRVEGAPLASDAGVPPVPRWPHAAPAGRLRQGFGWRTRGWLVAVPAVIVIAAGVAAVVRRAPSRILTVRDAVLLADVRNATGDRVFDDTLRLALAVSLEQAPFLRILPQSAVRSALARSGRSPDERVIGPVALDVCRREAAAVLLAGSIASLGSRYVIGLEAVACGTGESVARAMVEAESKERVLNAVEQAASRIRQRLGESRESLLRHDVPLVRATTPSIEALEALTLGDVQRDAGRYADALTHYRRAVELDPGFALAWARRGWTARGNGLREEAIPAMRRAFELEGRVSQPERFYIETLYYRLVAGDPDKAIETAQAWKRMYPGSAMAFNAVASVLSDELGQYEAAIGEAREAIRLEPSNAVPYNNLVQAYMGAGRPADAKRTVEEAKARGLGLDDMTMHAYPLIAALMEGDQATVERETRWAAGDPEIAVLFLTVRALAAAATGRLAESRRLWRQAIAGAREDNGPNSVASVQLEFALTEALAGDQRAARSLLDGALSTDRPALMLARAAIVAAFLDDTTRARVLLQGAARSAHLDPAPLRVWLPAAEALVLLKEGRPEEALGKLQPIARFARGNDFLTVPLAARGLASLSARRPAEAIGPFQEVVRLRAVMGPTAWEPVARLGLARAHRDAGNRAAAVAGYDEFLGYWKNADADLPLLAAARRERAALAAR